MFPIHKILHATDFSDLSRPAFELACSLARDYGAELVVCHVCPPAIIAAGNGMVVEMPSGEVEQTAARLKIVKPNDPRVRVKHQVHSGDAATEIIKFADDAKVDLIVMGTHGRTAFARLLMGSVAEAVMRKAPCPVVTVRASLSAERSETPAKKLVTA